MCFLKLFSHKRIWVVHYSDRGSSPSYCGTSCPSWGSETRFITVSCNKCDSKLSLSNYKPVFDSSINGAQVHPQAVTMPFILHSFKKKPFIAPN